MFLPKSPECNRRAESPEPSRRTKLLLTILTFCLLTLTLLAPPVKADVGGLGLEEFQRAVFSPGYNKQSFDFQSTIDLANTFTTAISGCVSDQPGCPKQHGAIHFIGTGIAYLYMNPPASGIQYFADVGERLNVVKPAYAQGGGYQSLQGVVQLWRAIRNLAYGLFVLLFIAIAFAIMFRVQLTPQVVITIQSALPRIIIALLLVTFSYAIAGFILDLALVFQTLFSNYISGQLGGIDKGALNILQIVGSVVGVTALIGVIPGLGPAGLAGSIAALAVLGIILALIALYAVIRFAFMLVFAYINILLATIFGPVIILFNTLPGRPLFWGWFSIVLSNALVFPLALILLMVGWWFITSADVSGAIAGSIFQGEGVIGAFAGLAKGLIGIGIILVIPIIVERIKNAIAQGLVPEGQIPGLAAGAATTAAFYKGYPGQLIWQAAPRSVAEGKANIARVITQALTGYRV